MNNQHGNNTADAILRPAPSWKFSDLRNILKLATNSLEKEKYSLAIDYCRKAVSAVMDSHSRDLIAEAYYIWCLSCLKSGKPVEARKVCYEARLKLGNYLDLVYFELLIAATNSEIDKIPRFADSFLKLYDQEQNETWAAGEKTRDKCGEVLLMGGKAKEQLGDSAGAGEYYKRYNLMFPDENQAANKTRRNSRPEDHAQGQAESLG